jgi:hypothetical protein
MAMGIEHTLDDDHREEIPAMLAEANLYVGSCTSILRIIATPENQVVYLRFTALEGGTRDDARPAS